MRFQQHDGVVMDMVEKFLQGFAKRLRERGETREREAGGLGLHWGSLRCAAPLLIL